MTSIRSTTFRLGEYSTVPAEHEKEIAERQEAVVIPVGDYLLQKQAQYRLWKAMPGNDKTLPKSLEGLWKSPAAFRIAMEKHHATKGIS